MTRHTPPLHLTRRAALAAAAALATGGARAQGKPMRIVVAFGPGSFNDLAARDLARYMGEILGQAIIVENKPGGGGSVGTDLVAKSAPDGTTLGLGTSSQMVMNVGLYRTLPFDVDKDLRLIGLVGRTPMLLAGKQAGAKTLNELIAQARARPGQISYGSAGAGSISHIVGEAFAKAADVQLTHVPYKGNGPALADLAGGHVDLVFDGLATARPLAEQGRIRLLAMSGQRRNPAAPHLPTFAEQGVRDYEAYSWNCLMAPSRTPPELIARLNAALNQALALPALKERFAQAGVDVLGPSTPEQADAFGHRERERWVPFVRSLRLQVG
ncbi:tripartite tricarboxylate transporter substrate binding protein [Ottowia sp.]|uniref:Bug family tripartite tricarboxylate transporter substrate binding protein n=1 Tax=Ottowia sp. TaxID=1898956 RepID=UPI002BEF44D0|nr:tripartite tricarboxylate transporter substrate binding protein [Ottowia sp.]HOB65138.1 tripartite tricarboxylate transporter substrate binding protein [Ottowia sp.]HPZ56227.1 tripartite tricarboxylate transporter substrate binding protein [Ottowia sp.]HQD46607.1 tripartite tricarboxylate transporter substrate binding protein [Ottowia sp.]